ncbi:thiamine pyrophosphate-dependent dehydrogenase E1 component subunit alpha [Steroidobacter sp. S1-65]|uniref:Thiamine pyrophosphate-dependent dehydrogenase E1 component subunit alpha n=1 Tax=Steroidobacter gossypii TaxID=2805490 RepID=A0ABS1X6U1_9GAMM|nr:thiamine pyrophosphate-dependent dehydrogenase E1 component subunit alpha [Steroidobacter gossypii]MBM0108900.1 thiamine pyrophosphate-dependent dehydrogenase E1 component subunit alpha [Steroidobacter gossypii]
MTETLQREAYRRMLRIRRFEEEGTRQFMQGKIPGAFHASIGQEGAIVGACLALRDEDMIVGTHRSHGHPIGKGASLEALMAELMAKSTGISKGRGGSMHLADRSVGIIGQSAIVGGGIPLATGAALSAKVRGSDQVCLCFFGDGAVNQGTFHESLNMGSLWKLPVVYLCENNGYAITTSLVESHAQPSIAKRADAYAVPGVTVDGQDVSAVYDAAHTAVVRARRGEGPTLIEAKTYRFDEHNVNLNAGMTDPYRPVEEVEYHKRHRDPIPLFRRALLELGLSESELTVIEREVDEAVAEAVRFADESPFPEPSELCENLYSRPIPARGKQAV